MNALEVALAEAITDALDAAPPPGGVHYHPAPQGTGLPVVTFQKQAAPAPSRTFGPGAGTIQWRTYVYLVRAIEQGESKAAAGALHETLVQGLDGADLVVDGFGTMLCQYQGDIEFPESVGGETYHHVGALFRIQLTP